MHSFAAVEDRYPSKIEAERAGAPLVPGHAGRVHRVLFALSIDKLQGLAHKNRSVSTVHQKLPSQIPP
jgi:hypothetical protein